jgi:Flp pilus assembly protein TadD
MPRIIGRLVSAKAPAVLSTIKAAKLAPDNARYTCVHAVAMDAAGRREEALGILQFARQRHPKSIEILAALVRMSMGAGDFPAAVAFARRFKTSRRRITWRSGALSRSRAIVEVNTRSVRCFMQGCRFGAI